MRREFKASSSLMFVSLGVPNSSPASRTPRAKRLFPQRRGVLAAPQESVSAPSSRSFRLTSGYSPDFTASWRGEERRGYSRCLILQQSRTAPIDSCGVGLYTDQTKHCYRWHGVIGLQYLGMVGVQDWKQDSWVRSLALLSTCYVSGNSLPLCTSVSTFVKWAGCLSA